ncbi:hypothetical protein [Escherichia coli]|uniref:hypothetical protein n=1 Tax=Escherichia coli TaxID=562 RepID=UPI000BE6C974|nr:hypothetical protein [Escherichia coli]
MKRVAELEEIATDYGMKFQRAQDALKHQSLLHKSQMEAAEKRIAELEAREVVLPQRQEPTSSGHYGEGYLVPSDTGSALDYEETVEAIRAAGISVKGE